MLTDLFGDPINVPQSASFTKPGKRHTLDDKRSKFLRLINSQKRAEAFITKLENGAAIPLFVDILQFLKAPLVPIGKRSTRSDREVVETLVETGEEVDGPCDPAVPCELWGEAWIEDRNALVWSFEGVSHLQVQVFWESMEELALLNNEHEKWSVFKWIFMPAVKKYYMYDKRINKSHVLAVHQRDEPFSFHNCCLAARMDADILRDMIRQRLPAEIFEAVKKVVTFL
mgnify:CR=1 FL=1